MGMFKRALKRILFPGFDLHNRSRCRHLPVEFSAGPLKTLDAGCGNGSLSYEAYRKGNHVLGVSFDVDAIKRANFFFSTIKSNRLTFEVMNLYNLDAVSEQYNQIICSETLEHITDDVYIIKQFSRLLSTGGILHLCCPNSRHPEHALGRVNHPEDGGHVRDGYTLESYKTLLEPYGFEIIKCLGLGTPSLVKFENFLCWIRSWGGDITAAPFFLAIWPTLQWVDRLHPTQPFSIYVKAIKKLEQKNE